MVDGMHMTCNTARNVINSWKLDGKFEMERKIEIFCRRWKEYYHKNFAGIEY
jgi:hypothetical protein